LVVVLMLAGPSTAHAAELSVSGGALRYTAAAGLVNDVTFDQTGPGTVRVTLDAPEDDDDITSGAGCVAHTPGVDYTCSEVTRIVADVGDQSDRITATGVETLPSTLSGGDGSDAINSGAGDDILFGGPGDDKELHGGAGNNTLDGGAGDDVLEGFVGDDALRGGEGNDVLRPDVGTDTVDGGDGIDRVIFGYRVAPSYTLDGLPNDGGANENDLIGADVEEIEAPASDSGTVVMVGDGRSNRLTVTDGHGDITGGEGSDVLEGGPLADTIRARDGSPDTVLCGAGIDTVEADTLDVVSTTCENVTRQPTPGGPFDDRPPQMTWTAPEAGVSLSANRPTTLAVNATDDRGLERVQFFDDDRLVCDDPDVPFTCEYQPRGGDVGRNTLLAVGIDGANQTTTLVRPVTVRRFSSPGFSLSIRPSRDRRPPYAFRAIGRLQRPAPVAPSQGCSGEVRITAKTGRRTAATRRVRLSRNCEYSLTLRFRSRPAKRLRVTARFAGNDVLASRRARSRTIRLG
jgi:Ca2+-binding RTX toxin-like protein